MSVALQQLKQQYHQLQGLQRNPRVESLSSLEAARSLYRKSLERSKQRLRELLLPPAQAPGAADVATAPAHANAHDEIAAAGPSPQLLEPLYGQDGALRSAVLYLVAHASRAFMTSLNSVSVEGAEHLAAALQRQPGVPLVTVSNHVASMDDPLVIASITPPGMFADPDSLRWTLCATDRCFHRAALVPFFRAAKVLPVERGAGMSQPGLLAAEERLAAGDWVHIFPEGTRSRDGKLLPMRKGVGRLVVAAARAGAPGGGQQLPLVVPFVHSGMEGVLPKGSVVPKVGQQVAVIVGAPIRVDDLLAAAAAQGWADDQLYARITARISTHMHALKAQLDGQPLSAETRAALEDDAALVCGKDLYDPSDRPGGSAGWAARLGGARQVWEQLVFEARHRAFSAAPAAVAAAGGGGGGDGTSPGAGVGEAGSLLGEVAAARQQVRAAWATGKQRISSAVREYYVQRTTAMEAMLLGHA